MPLDRTQIISGPCQIIYDGLTFYSTGDVTLRPVIESFTPTTSAFGALAPRMKSVSWEVTLEPVHHVNAGLEAVFWGAAAKKPGDSLFPAVDKPLVIHGRSGTKVTLTNAAVSQMPPLRMGAGVMLCGQMKFTGLLGKGMNGALPAAYIKIETAAYPGDEGFSPYTVHTAAALGAWGDAAPWDDFCVESPGWEITPTMRTNTVETDCLGVIDIRLSELEVTARAVPVGPTEAQILAALAGHPYPAPGSTLASGNDLVVANGIAAGTEVTLTGAGLMETELVWGAQRKRVQACVWRATPVFAAGVMKPLLKVENI